MTVTIQDVRELLSGLASTRVGDDTITKHLQVAENTVTSEKSETATQIQVETAIMLQAAYGTLEAYATQLERSVGSTPPEVSRQLEILKELADLSLTYVRRAAFTPIPLVAQPETLGTQYEDGDLVGDRY